MPHIATEKFHTQLIMLLIRLGVLFRGRAGGLCAVCFSRSTAVLSSAISRAAGSELSAAKRFRSPDVSVAVVMGSTAEFT